MSSALPLLCRFTEYLSHFAIIHSTKHWAPSIWPMPFLQGIVADMRAAIVSCLIADALLFIAPVDRRLVSAYLAQVYEQMMSVQSPRGRSLS